MRSAPIALAFAIGLFDLAAGFGRAPAATPSATATAIPYAIATSRYFVKNNVPLRTRTFFVIRDFATFQKIFGYGAVMGPPQPVVTAADFATKMYFVPVAQGGLCTLTVLSVSAVGASYRVEYRSVCEPKDSATYDVPVIIAVRKGPVASVTFVENGRFAGEVKE